VILCVAVSATLPFWASRYWSLLFLMFFLYLALAQAWNLLGGYSGLVSLGQQSFIGLGGYTVAVLSVYYGVPIWFCLPIAGVVAGMFGLVISGPLFRMRGEYFAVASWIVSESLSILFSNWAYVGYGSGMFIKPAYSLSLTQMYYAGLCVAVAAVITVCGVLTSKTGLGLMAACDNETAAGIAGVDVTRCRLYSFLVSALLTGVAAGLLYSYQVFIQPYKAFGIEWTVRIVFIVVIGGIGSIEGPIIGAAILVCLQQYFSDYPSAGLLLMGLTAMLCMLLAPRGIAGLIREKTGLELFPIRYG